MKASVVTIEELLKIQHLEEDRATNFFDNNIHYYTIPKYQREFKWVDEKVEDLLLDTFNKQKFIGIVALEELKGSYEIVDGQQRITTIFLVLVRMFNFLQKDESVMNNDQKNILKYLYQPSTSDIKIYNESIMKNSSDFLKLNRGSLTYDIHENVDIYSQKSSFDRVVHVIDQFFYEKFHKIDGVYNRSEILKYKDKLLKSKVLVFVNTSEQDESIEEIYVDVNHKSQKLDVEDIFKGYCFSIVDKDDHDTLKGKWVDLKSMTNFFKSNFKFKNFGDLLYIYYLSQNKYKNVTEVLTINKEFVIKNDTSDDVLETLDNIINYCRCILNFYNEVKEDNYNFEKYCYNSKQHKASDQYNNLRYLSLYILRNGAQYHKLPLFKLIELLNLIVLKKVELDFSQLYSIVTKLYMYSVTFNTILDSKKKENIEYQIINSIENYNCENHDESIVKISCSIDDVLDKRLNESNTVLDSINQESSYAMFSIVDNFDKNNKRFNMVYAFERGFNDEHFLLNNNDRIEWRIDDKKIIIKIHKNILLNYNNSKNSVLNNLVMDKDLNGKLGSSDIVEKIRLIKKEYNSTGKDIPKHISIYIDTIEKMSKYNELEALKKSKCNDEKIIESAYIEFLTDYFDMNTKNRKTILEQVHKEIKSKCIKKK